LDSGMVYAKTRSLLTDLWFVFRSVPWLLDHVA